MLLMFYLIKRRKPEILHRRALNFLNYWTVNRRGTDSASVLEASPNAVLPDISFSPRLNASINSFLPGRYFGEISRTRIKKLTLPYVVSMLCPIHSFAVSFICSSAIPF